jgi:hypothetical protein
VLSNEFLGKGVSGDRISTLVVWSLDDVVLSFGDVVEYHKVVLLVVWFRDPICTSFPPSYMGFRTV